MTEVRTARAPSWLGGAGHDAGDVAPGDVRRPRLRRVVPARVRPVHRWHRPAGCLRVGPRLQSRLARGHRRGLPELPGAAVRGRRVSLSRRPARPPGRGLGDRRRPPNGDIYYSSNWDDSIERFDRFGNHLATVRIGGGWNSWFDVDQHGDLLDRQREPAVHQLLDPALPQRRDAVELLEPAEHLPEGDDDLRDRCHVRRPRVPAGFQQPADPGVPLQPVVGLADLRPSVRLDGTRHRPPGHRVRRGERVGLHLRRCRQPHPEVHPGWELPLRDRWTGERTGQVLRAAPARRGPGDGGAVRRRLRELAVPALRPERWPARDVPEPCAARGAGPSRARGRRGGRPCHRRPVGGRHLQPAVPALRSRRGAHRHVGLPRRARNPTGRTTRARSVSTR